MEDVQGVYVVLTSFSCSFINKMGQLHRMLIRKACPYQQMESSNWTETTNGTTTQHHAHQQMCWSTRWVNHPDCSFWPHFTFLVTPKATKWVARPIWNWATAEDIMQNLQWWASCLHVWYPCGDGLETIPGTRDLRRLFRNTAWGAMLDMV